MKTKFGTVIEENILENIKLLAIKNKKSINKILEEAVNLYLKKQNENPQQKISLVEKTSFGN